MLANELLCLVDDDQLLTGEHGDHCQFVMHRAVFGLFSTKAGESDRLFGRSAEQRVAQLVNDRHFKVPLRAD